MTVHESSSVKREAEEPSRIADYTLSDTPLTKRFKFFNQINEVKPKSDLKSRVISSADPLSDYELRECYNIANAALKAQFNRKMNPKTMEDFFYLVFNGWNTDSGPPAVKDLDHFPFGDATWNGTSNPVGQIHIEGQEQEVFQAVCLLTEPIDISMEIRRTTNLAPKEYCTLTNNDVLAVKWKPREEVQSATRKNWKSATIAVANAVASYNRKRAISYARNFLAHQANGSEAPLVGRYTFASFDLILNALPPLRVEDLHEGPNTVAVFGVGELGSGWTGKSAKFGNRVLRVD